MKKTKATVDNGPFSAVPVDENSDQTMQNMKHNNRRKNGRISKCGPNEGERPERESTNSSFQMRITREGQGGGPGRCSRSRWCRSHPGPTTRSGRRTGCSPSAMRCRGGGCAARASRTPRGRATARRSSGTALGGGMRRGSSEKAV